MHLRLLHISIAVVLFIATLTFAPTARAGDPTLVWKTIETPHFRVTYDAQSEPIAQRVADLAEAIHQRLVPAVGWAPGHRTEILLADNQEGANGSASALPYNALRLLITAPDDMSPLADVDDWYLELVTHEYTHILHTDHIEGVPAILNTLMGKTFAPNQVQPRWILEGLAVFEETARTSGGRLKSSQWNMYMRTDVMSDNVATLDQFSNTIRRWPQGNIWYLYGSYFLQWIADTYGEDALRKMADDYGRHIIPWGFNRSIRRATGRTFEELYAGWVATMKRSYGAQVAEIERQGIREGTRLTHSGQTMAHARWIPDNAWPDHKGHIVFYRDDGRSRGGLYALPITRDARGAVVSARENDSELLIRTNGDSAPSFAPDGGVVFDSQDVWSNLYTFYDLFELGTGVKSPSGADGKRTRWTGGFRATDPSVSPDGRRVVFTTNHHGTRYLQIADITDGGIAHTRALVQTPIYDQVYTPRWSPDGTHVAYGAWSHGGYRDIRLVDVRDGSWIDVTHDRAVDGGPSFSADGKWLFFHSDRTGVMNVYAWEVGTANFRQVTNVVTGAYQPELSPDKKTLLYVGYTKSGFDLFAMPVDESTWPPAPAYVDTRPSAPAPATANAYVPHAYRPLDTLIPTHYSVQITPGSFGQAAILSAAGNDLVGHHGVAASLTAELEKPDFQGSLAYGYSRLPFDASVSAYRAIAPRAGYGLGAYKPTVIQETVGVATAISYSIPRAFDAQSFALSYSAARVGAELPFPIEKLDPAETPSFPQRGFLGILHLGYGWSNAERYLWSVGPERGTSFGASFDVTDPALGSEFRGYSVNADLTTYFTMPWLRHHSLALHGGTGTSGGGFPGRGAFYVGGYVDLPLVDTTRNTLVQGGIVLRGYAPVAMAGRSYALFNAEYRFPIVDVERGPSTLPIFLTRITGAAFVDYGSAFDSAATALFKTGTGGELWSDWTLGYVVNFTFRLGYAHGWASEGIDKVYFVAAVPF